jgi:hypothetical protein
LAVQNAVSPREIGVATSTTQFFRQIGSTIGVAVFGTLLTNNLSAAAGAMGAGRRLTLSGLETMAAAQAAKASGSQGPVTAALIDHTSQAVIATAMNHVFLSGLIVLAVGVVTTVLIPAARLRGRGPTLSEDLEAVGPVHPTSAAVLETA